MSGCLDAHLPLGRGPKYPLDSRLDGFYRWSGRCGKEKIIDFTETPTPNHRHVSLQPVVIPSALSPYLNNRI
jgi:hypothetical protein